MYVHLNLEQGWNSMNKQSILTDDNTNRHTQIHMFLHIDVF